MQAPELIELKIGPLPLSAEPDTLAAILARFDPLGTASETDADSGETCMLAWFDAGRMDARLRAQLDQALRQAAANPAPMAWRKLASTDWSMAWQAHWQAQPVGRTLWVRPSFREAAPEGRIDIVLDPGMAFGTGQHETTRLCLEAIERALMPDNAAGQPPRTLLDMGAGSGILAIAALKLGVAQALAIDNDPDAIAACRKNAEINGVRLDARLDDAPPAARFDLVVANILAGPLIAMAPALAGCTEQQLTLSGILASQDEGVVAAYEAQGLRCERRDRLGEWIALTFRRDTRADDAL